MDSSLYQITLRVHCLASPHREGAAGGAQDRTPRPRPPRACVPRRSDGNDPGTGRPQAHGRPTCRGRSTVARRAAGGCGPPWVGKIWGGGGPACDRTLGPVKTAPGPSNSGLDRSIHEAMEENGSLVRSFPVVDRSPARLLARAHSTAGRRGHSS
jgi:hypothetical protein